MDKRADVDDVRPDLAEVQERHEVGLDAARPDAVARRRKTGQHTARENIEELCDAGTFVEYGPIVVARELFSPTVYVPPVGTNCERPRSTIVLLPPLD